MTHHYKLKPWIYMSKKVVIIFLTVILFTIIQFNFASAQCALCKATVETSLQEGNTSAAGLNVGILYLLIMPYALIGGLGYWWYSNNKKKKLLETKSVE